jgi:outer membrane protein insertion porin family
MNKITNHLMLFFLLLAAGSWPAILCAAGQSSAGHADAISSIEVRGLFSIKETELLNLLNIGRGSVLDRSMLSSGVRRAFLTGIFDDITVESPDPDHSAIVVKVKEKPVIDSIEVKENGHFSTGFIKKQLNFKTGDRLNGLAIREGITEVEEAMHKRGFTDAGASYAIVPVGKNSVSIEITIFEGPPELIKQVMISSHAEIINNYLKLSAGGIFDRTEMDDFRNKVIQYCKKQNFVGASLSYNFRNGVLTINFDPGKKLTVTFIGNTAIKTAELIKETPFFEIGKINDDLIEETVASIISLYRRNGFILAQAKPVISASPENIQLEIFIFEGERYKVGAITFEGAHIPQEKLRDILEAKEGDYYSPDDLDADGDRLTDFYHALGYLYVEVHEPDIVTQDNSVSIKFVINEKQQIKITNIEIVGAKLISDVEILKIIPARIGNPYNEFDIAESQRKILELYNNRGFLECKVLVGKEIADASSVVRLVVNEGAMTLFGKNIIIGNERTKPEVIEREFLHKMNEPFDYSKLLKEKQHLYRLGLFSDVEVNPSAKSDSERDVLYKFREADAGTIDFGPGYGEYEKYRAFLEVSYRNLFGMDRQASFRTEISSIEKRFILSYSEPFFFIRDLTFKSSLLYENKRELNIDTREISYHLTKETASAGVEKKLSDTIKAGLNYDFSVVNTTDVQPDIILSREDTGSLIISGLRPELIYDTRDNPFDPKKGLLAGFSFKAASDLLFSQTDFLKLSGYANKYEKLSNRIVLAVSLRCGVAEGYNHTTELPIVERFFLGGRTSVRGYDQDTLGPKGADGTPTGGDAFLMGNFELRTDVGRGFGIVTFVDTGNVWEKIKDIDVAQLRFTSGLGLRYNTPVGPLSVDYGVKLSREKGESLGAIHFSIGHAF